MDNARDWNENWQFARMNWADADTAKLMEGFEPVTLPHTWYVDGEYFRGQAVYQKSFVPRLGEGQRLIARFRGVDQVSEVYVNGKKAGGHRGGYSIFAFDLTPYLVEGTNVITVFADNTKHDDVSPLGGDFTIFGGMHRDVELLIKNAVHFDATFVGTEGVLVRPLTDGADGIAEVCAVIAGQAGDLKVRYTVKDAEGKTCAEETYPAEGKHQVRVPAAHFWNGKKDPYLYTVTAELLADGAVTDSVTLTTGFRSFLVDAEEGFFLNGRHLKLGGVAKHQDTAGVFSAAGEANWKEDMDLIAEIGANCVRLSHYQHPERVYDLCDEMGFVVWAEIPMLQMTEDDGLLANAKDQLQELILQNLNHPSICFWGIQNEIGLRGYQNFMAERTLVLQKYAKELDDSRYTASANEYTTLPESGLNGISDAQGYNLYYGWYYGEMPDFQGWFDNFHAVRPEVPLGMSEYGVDCSVRFHSDTPKVKDYTEDYQALFHETVYPYMKERDYIWGTFVWNMFDFASGMRDEGGTKFRNCKGLVTHDRKTRKDAFYYYQAQWSETPVLTIAQKHYVKRAGETMNVKVYSNLPEVTLTVGGQKYTLASDTGVFRFEGLPLAMGDNEVVAEAGGLKDTFTFIGVEESEKSYVFVDPNPGINVRNWFVSADEKEAMFPDGTYSVMDKAETIFANDACMGAVKECAPNLAGAIENICKDGFGTFTVAQMLERFKGICTEDQAKELNNRLTSIGK